MQIKNPNSGLSDERHHAESTRGTPGQEFLAAKYLSIYFRRKPSLVLFLNQTTLLLVTLIRVSVQPAF